MDRNTLKRSDYPKSFVWLLSMILLLSGASAWGGENPCSYSGYLWGTGARSSFEVYCGDEKTQVLFSWPSGTSDFRIKVTDTDRTEVLADRSLKDGDLFLLEGSGIFHFEIYSAWGTGCWKATVKKIE